MATNTERYLALCTMNNEAQTSKVQANQDLKKVGNQRSRSRSEAAGLQVLKGKVEEEGDKEISFSDFMQLAHIVHLLGVFSVVLARDVHYVSKKSLYHNAIYL